jgi:hypothetical protein
MTSSQVARILRAPTVVASFGSTAWLYIPICAGQMQGLAIFEGPDSDRPGDSNGLEELWFSAGASTRAGVGIGSTRGQVLHAFGSALQHDGSNLYIVGNPVQLYPGTYVRPAVYFAFRGSRVSTLGYGARGEMISRSDGVAGQPGGAPTAILC